MGQLQNNVKQLRRQKNDMTQINLAKMCGVTRQTISALEANRYSPSLELAFKIAEALGVSITEVFSHTNQT